MVSPPRPPEESGPSTGWEHYALWQNVRTFAQHQVHKRFRSVVHITGISVGDIYTFGQTLNATVEEEFVRTLNENRDTWDPDQGYEGALFERQSEVFPDILLKTGDRVIFGIELKTWYLLAKEGEPSFRMRQSPKACADGDLMIVVPWVLSNVLSGSPIVFEPYVRQLRYVAEYRNYWWQHVRKSADDVSIQEPQEVRTYPLGRERILDTPAYDPGNNFGRIARTGLLDAYVRALDGKILLGKTVREWRQFFKS